MLAPQYPVNLVVADRPCLVVGGGALAAQKAAALLACGAEVHVVGEEIGEEVRALPVAWEERSYARGEASDYRFVIAATGSPATNATVYADADAAGVWVNSADDPDHCSATLPAVLRRGALVVTVSTGGRSPAIASWLKARLADEIGPEYEALLDLVAGQREAVRAGGRSTEGLNWQKALDSDMLELIKNGHVAEARERLQACLSSSSD
ncbi:MAG: bifunctional precorrin-2 dehydrogenase/sirohydrochlorin ferrochelatase [Acidimicrobiia bacterium]|nr:bifunctional precorrin-2 dehydrogenase/sirohydrochlorin ferrochelatase [Acidimicrobiia bacterium]